MRLKPGRHGCTPTRFGSAGDGKYSDREKFGFPSFIMTDLKMPNRDGFAVSRPAYLRLLPTKCEVANHAKSECERPHIESVFAGVGFSTCSLSQANRLRTGATG